MAQITTGIIQMARVILSVADQDRALDFYVGKLGFEKIADVPYGDGQRWVEVAPPGGGTPIALAIPMGVEASGGAMTGISFKTADADALHAELRGLGVDVDPEVMRVGDPVPPMFFFRDHEANVLHVSEES